MMQALLLKKLGALLCTLLVVTLAAFALIRLIPGDPIEIMGPALGIAAALRRGSWLDQCVMALATVGNSMPVFWWGLILMFFQRRAGMDAGVRPHRHRVRRGCRHTRCPLAVARCARKPPLLRSVNGRSVACHLV